MQIIIDSLIAGAQRARGTVIIIDVFRAFTTEAIAFSRGAEKVILVSTPKDALELRDRGIADLCVGEVHGMTPEGFDHNNSPHEMSIADVKGKVLAHSTMAGTVGVNAATNADEIYVGSLVIARSTVDTILQDKPDLVTIVAMGDGGKIRTDEDEQCAWYLKNLLGGRRPDPQAVRALVLAGEESQKYHDPAQEQYHPKDLEMATRIDSVDFAIGVERRDGLLVARPIRPA